MDAYTLPRWMFIAERLVDAERPDAASILVRLSHFYRRVLRSFRSWEHSNSSPSPDPTSLQQLRRFLSRFHEEAESFVVDSMYASPCVLYHLGLLLVETGDCESALSYFSSLGNLCSRNEIGLSLPCQCVYEELARVGEFVCRFRCASTREEQDHLVAELANKPIISRTLRNFAKRKKTLGPCIAFLRLLRVTSLLSSIRQMKSTPSLAVKCVDAVSVFLLHGLSWATRISPTTWFESCLRGILVHRWIPSVLILSSLSSFLMLLFGGYLIRRMRRRKSLLSLLQRNMPSEKRKTNFGTLSTTKWEPVSTNVQEHDPADLSALSTEYSKKKGITEFAMLRPDDSHPFARPLQAARRGYFDT